MNLKKLLHVTILGCCASSAQAATTVTSATFTGSATAQTFNVTSASVVDWGYYNRRNNFQTVSNPDNDKNSSGIGAVTFTSGAISDGSFGIAAATYGTFVFSGGSSPASGTDNTLGASFGDWGTTEANGASVVFNNLGVGNHTVTFYAGHSANSGGTSRELNVNYSLATTDGTFTDNENSGTVAGRVIHGTYTMEFSTTDASADLTLTLNSVSGESGSGWIGGYIVETAPIPEPSSAILLSLSGFALLRRRRK